jgi:ornithine carbamoyltransferase
MKHFLDLANWDTAEVKHILDLAIHLKKEWQTGGNRPVLNNKILGMIFQKPSLRTRVSFEVGMKHLGGSAIMLGPQEIGLGKRESIPDIARVLSSYVDIIMARVFDHAHVTGLAQWSRVPVINGLSDESHPCQAMADILTIYERFGRLEGLKLAYVGDGNNVAVSLLHAAAHFGVNFAIATPEGYELPQSVRETTAKISAQTGIEVLETTHPQMAVEGADVIYTDTWISMGQEAEAAERRATFTDFQVNKNLLRQSKGSSIVLHCLPAHRGEEITDDVADGEQSAIFQQAENRLHAQKAILVHLLNNR